MALKITGRVVDNVEVLDLEGRIVLGEESNAMRERVKQLLAQNKKKIVLNMANVTYIDSVGVGTLVAVRLSAEAQGTALKVANLGKRSHEVLKLVKIEVILRGEVYDSEAAAVASFK